MDERPKGRRESGLSAGEGAKMLGVSAARLEVLAGQGRLKAEGPIDALRYDLDGVHAMQAEDFIREMLEEAKDSPELRGKIETLAMLQYQRGREASQRAEHWEIVERVEKANRELVEELREANAAAERRMEEMRAMEEGRLRRGPFRERRAG